MHAFPTWRYSEDNEPRLVQDEAELLALGPGWYDNPLFEDRPPAAAAEEAPSHPAVPKVEFPKWLYAREASPRFIRTQEEQEALEGKWFDHPDCLEAQCVRPVVVKPKRAKAPKHEE